MKTLQYFAFLFTLIKLTSSFASQLPDEEDRRQIFRSIRNTNPLSMFDLERPYSYLSLLKPTPTIEFNINLCNPKPAISSEDSKKQRQGCLPEVPDEILGLIFHQLPTVDYISARTVCKRFERITGQPNCLLSHFAVVAQSLQHDERRKHLQDCFNALWPDQSTREERAAETLIFVTDFGPYIDMLYREVRFHTARLAVNPLMKNIFCNLSCKSEYKSLRQLQQIEEASSYFKTVTDDRYQTSMRLLLPQLNERNLSKCTFDMWIGFAPVQLQQLPPIDLNLFLFIPIVGNANINQPEDRHAA